MLHIRISEDKTKLRFDPGIEFGLSAHDLHNISPKTYKILFNKKLIIIGTLTPNLYCSAKSWMA